MSNVPLSSTSRSAALAAMAGTSDNPLDILVIGGGVTGAGSALDAVTRGLNVGLVEARDWAGGTSSRSSKLMHGGLRYLEMLDFALVREALHERDLLLKTTAPHLVRPIAFLYPLQNPVVERAYVGAGIGLYDMMATRFGKERGVPFHKHLSRSDIEKDFQSLSEDAAVGALQYWDAQMDDARFVHMLVRTAASYGAHAANRTQVTDFIHRSGRVVGVKAVDLESGREFEIHAKSVISATGVWTEKAQQLAGAEGGLKVRASKGVHIAVSRDAIKAKDFLGIISKTEKSVLFVIPWDNFWVVGTTDTDWQEDVAHPMATRQDVDYLLDHVNKILTEPISRDDILGVYSGLRPLLQPVEAGQKGSAKVSREHTVLSPTPGLVSIAGGKYTTYRVMAEDAVDFALKETQPNLTSITEKVTLIGADGYEVRKRQSAAIASKYGFDQDRVRRLLFRYGALIDELLGAIDADASLGRPLEGAPQYLRVEARYAASHEGAIHLEDVLERRMRLNYENRDRGMGVADEVTELIAPILGWDEAACDKEKASFVSKVEAELAAEEVASDAEAVSLAHNAEEIVTMRES